MQLCEMLNDKLLHKSIASIVFDAIKETMLYVIEDHIHIFSFKQEVGFFIEFFLMSIF